MLRYVYRRFHGFLFLWRLRDNISWSDDELFGGNRFPFALDWNIQLTGRPKSRHMNVVSLALAIMA
jgi:hypothetical protein